MYDEFIFIWMRQNIFSTENYCQLCTYGEILKHHIANFRHVYSLNGF